MSRNTQAKYGSSVMWVAASAAAMGVGYVIGCGYWKKNSRAVLDLDETYIPKELRHTPYSKELRLAVRLALEAGKRIKAYLDTKGTLKHSTLECQTKSNVTDFATELDVQIEARIVEVIKRTFPSHNIIGEEMSESQQSININKAKAGLTWIIDPIDGTTNFCHGLPLTCVSLGLTDESGQPVMGCVYAPATDELFLAIKGCGAYRNCERIFANTYNIEKSINLSYAIVVFEFGYVYNDAESIEKLVRAFSAVLKLGIRASRCLGSGVLDLCYLACGKINAVYCGVANEAWKPWDYCAGMLMIQEAQAVITTLMDEQDDQAIPQFDIYAKSMIAATSKELVTELKCAIRQSQRII